MIDVCLTTYNGEKYVKEQIESILSQLPENANLLVSDDCSTDGTLNLLKEYPIKILKNVVNRGILGNFSSVLEAATGDYIFLSDMDDVWLPGKIEKSLQTMYELEKRHGKDHPILVHTDLHVVDAQLQSIHPSYWKFSKIHPAKGQTFPRLLAQNCVTGCTMLVNRALLNKALPVPQEAVMHDWWLALVAVAFGTIEAIPEATILYRQHQSNDTGAKRLGVKKKNVEKAKQAQALAFLERYNVHRELLEDFLCTFSCSPWKKMQLMARHGFYKHGFLRNLREVWR